MGWARAAPVISMRAPETTALEGSCTVPEIVCAHSQGVAVRKNRSRTGFDRREKHRRGCAGLGMVAKEKNKRNDILACSGGTYSWAHANSRLAASFQRLVPLVLLPRASRHHSAWFGSFQVNLRAVCCCEGLCRRSLRRWFMLAALPFGHRGGSSEPIARHASSSGIFRRLPVRNPGLDAGAREHLPGIALAHDRAVSRGPHPSRGRRAQPAECFLRRPGEWRRLEIGRLRTHLEPDLR